MPTQTPTLQNGIKSRNCEVGVFRLFRHGS